MKQVKHTGQYYFNRLSPKTQEKFKEEITVDCGIKGYLKHKFIGNESFISGAFVWEKTKDGFNYWYNQSIGGIQ